MRGIRCCKGRWEIREKRSVLSTGIFLSVDTHRKQYMFPKQNQNFDIRTFTARPGEKRTNEQRQKSEYPQLLKTLEGTYRRQLALQRIPPNSWKPLQAALRGHATLYEWGQPLTFRSCILCKSVLNMDLQRMMGQRVVGRTDTSSDGLSSYYESGGKQDGRSFSCFFYRHSSLTQLEDTLASFCRSLSFCWQQHIDFSGFDGTPLLCYMQYRLALTRLLALTFLVSTLLSAVILLMFSWASFNLQK